MKVPDSNYYNNVVMPLDVWSQLNTLDVVRQAVPTDLLFPSLWLFQAIKPKIMAETGKR